MRLRLLLSWKERLALQPRLDVRAQRTADAAIRALLGQARGAVEQAGERLRSALAAQQAGRPVTDEQLARIRHEITQFNVLLKATSSADLGGFADLPIDQYPEALGLPTPGAGWLDRDDRITIVVAPILMVVICLSIAWYHLWRADVQFNLDRPSSREVELHFMNESNFTTYFYGPWPESETDLAASSFGVTLHCREVGADAFQDCTNIREAWTYQRQPLSPRKPIQVETGISVTVLLNLDVLEQVYGTTIEEVRLECGGSRGWSSVTFTESVLSK